MSLYGLRVYQLENLANMKEYKHDAMSFSACKKVINFTDSISEDQVFLRSIQNMDTVSSHALPNDTLSGGGVSSIDQ